MGEMDRDLRIPVVGHEVAEHQREVGNRQAGAGVPHRRAHENLDVDERSRRCGRAGVRSVRIGARAGVSVAAGPCRRSSPAT